MSWGDWLSWLERRTHIAEVTGSNPVSPTWYDSEVLQGVVPSRMTSQFPTFSAAATFLCGSVRIAACFGEVFVSDLEVV